MAKLCAEPCFGTVTNTAHEWFPIAGGAFLGITANLIWTTAAYISFAYSTEGTRGSFISMQWGLLSVFSRWPYPKSQLGQEPELTVNKALSDRSLLSESTSTQANCRFRSPYTLSSSSSWPRGSSSLYSPSLHRPRCAGVMAHRWLITHTRGCGRSSRISANFCKIGDFLPCLFLCLLARCLSLSCRV